MVCRVQPTCPAPRTCAAPKTCSAPRMSCASQPCGSRPANTTCFSSQPVRPMCGRASSWSSCSTPCAGRTSSFWINSRPSYYDWSDPYYDSYSSPYTPVYNTSLSADEAGFAVVVGVLAITALMILAACVVR